MNYTVVHRDQARGLEARLMPADDTNGLRVWVFDEDGIHTGRGAYVVPPARTTHPEAGIWYVVEWKPGGSTHIPCTSKEQAETLAIVLARLNM